MDRRKKIIWGIFSIWPICWLILSVCGAMDLVMGTGMGMSSQQSNDLPPIVAILMVFIMFFHFATIIEIWVMIILYIIRILKDESFDQNNKILWVILIIFFSFITMPLFWYLNIWQEKDLNIIKK